MNTTAVSKSKLSSVIDKLILYFFPVLCLFIPIAFYLRTYDSCQIKITSFEMGTTIFIGLWLIKLLEDDNIFDFAKGYGTLILPVAAFLVSGIISYYLSPFKSTSIEELIKRVLYVGTFFLVAFSFDKKERIERLLLWIFLAATLVSLYGIIQILGLDPFMWKGAFGDRAFSTFGNPNFFSAFLVWVSPLLLAYIFLTRKWAYSFIFIISCICVWQAKSKGGWVGLPFGVLMFTILAVKYLSHAKKTNVKRGMILFVTITMLVCGFGVYRLSKGRMNSIMFRIYTWEATWKMINHPVYVSPAQSKLLGTGIGTFKIVYPAYRMPQIFHIEGKHNTETDHPENEFLEVWYDEGTIGFGIFLLMLLTIYWAGIYKIKYFSLSLQSLFRKNMTPVQLEHLEYEHYLIGLIAGISGLLTHNLMCVNMRFVSSGFFLWVLLGLVVAVVRAGDMSINKINENIQKNNNNKKNNIYVFLQIVAAVIIIFLSINFYKLFLADMTHNRGIAYSKAKMWDKAINEYRKVLRYNPNYIMAYYFMGNVFNDRWDNSKKYNPNWGDKNNIARTDAERTLEAYNNVKKKAPNYVQVHFQTGIVYSKLGDIAKAKESFNKYLKIDPVFPETYFQLGMIYSQEKNFSEAEKMFKGAIENNPGLGDAYLNLGNFYYMTGKFDLAEKTYLAGIEKDSTNSKLFNNVFSIYMKQNRLQDIKNMCEKYLKLDPKNEYLRKVLSSMLVKK
jgi:tetratricopeptide (TPR) repeat protein/O-antigen ligase